MYKRCLSSLRKKILILTHFIGGMKDIIHISPSAGPNMTVLHYVNNSYKGTCMSSIVHLLVLGSLVPGSKIFFLHFIFSIFFLDFLYFPTASIHDIQRAY